MINLSIFFGNIMLPWIWVFNWGCTTSISDLGPWSPWTFLTLGSRDVCLGGCGMAFQGLGERYEPRRVGRAEDGEVWGYICHEGMKLVEWQVFFGRCFNARIWNPSGEGGSLAVLQPAKAWKRHESTSRDQCIWTFHEIVMKLMLPKELALWHLVTTSTGCFWQKLWRLRLVNCHLILCKTTLRRISLFLEIQGF